MHAADSRPNFKKGRRTYGGIKKLLMVEADTYADTEAEAIMIDKAECIEIARTEEESKARAEDDMIKQVWRAKSLGPRLSLTDRTFGIRLEPPRLGSKGLCPPYLFYHIIFGPCF